MAILRPFPPLPPSLMSDTTPEKHVFQAEIQQLLELVVHSLYTDKEIFLRELVSNASDAMEKLRHIEATEKNVHQPTLPLEIHITTDKEANTLTISDHGIGMSHEELIRNLGTIAHSGTKSFLKSIKEGSAAPANLIGQFGVGFYSAFMVSDKVCVHSRSWHAAMETCAMGWSGSSDRVFRYSGMAAWQTCASRYLCARSM